MTTKDYVYLGLLLLTALIFYCNGFYSGVYRMKRVYDIILTDDVEEPNGADDEPNEAHQPRSHQTFVYGKSRSNDSPFQNN